MDAESRADSQTYLGVLWSRSFSPSTDSARGPGALPCFKVAKERWLTTSGVTIMKKNRNELSHLNERVSNATC